jgi:DNA-binding CsgD family transcriptional regulator
MNKKNCQKKQKTAVFPDLTNREQEILDLLFKGSTPKEIAFNLGIKYRTVDFHRNNVYRKLGVQSIQELFAKYSMPNTPALKIMPDEMATPEKPLVMDFYDNSFYNSETIWQYKITPSIFYFNKITAGERYTFSYSFKSNINFNFLDLTLVDGSPEANFFTVLGPPIRQVNNSKANIEYKNSVTFNVVKTASSTKPEANELNLEINSDKSIQPTLVFTMFELIKN